MIDTFVAAIEVYTREQLLEAIDSGAFELYQLHDSAWSLVEFIDTAYGKTMNILTTVGRLDEWRKGWDALEKIARDNECNCIFSVGHPAWKKFVESVGFKTTPMLKMVKFLEYAEDL